MSNKKKILLQHISLDSIGGENNNISDEQVSA